MRVAGLAAVIVLALVSVAPAGIASPGVASSQTPIGEAPPKTDTHVRGVNIPGCRVGGETVETAVVIPAIPFTDTGNTCPFVDNYDEMCPYDAVSPDCVYSYTATEDMFIDIDLCMSEYDTKVYVYENSTSSLLACNDDNMSCTPPVFMYQSLLTDVPLYAGNTYYIVIDGYGSDCGEYVLDILYSPLCVVFCPPEGVAEGEVVCYDGYVDDYNGGCWSVPDAYTFVDCSNETIGICGTGGVFDFNGASYRDTDWYMLTLDEPTTVTLGIIAEFNPLAGFLDFTNGCANVEFYDYVTPWKCEYAELSYNLPAGQTVVFVSPASGDPQYECGSNYYLTIDGYECTSPVKETSWGSIKSLYR